MVLTPHFYPHKEDPERFLKRRDRSLEKLKASMADQSQAGGQEVWPELIAGAEVYYFHELAVMAEKDLESLCIGGSKCLMVELPMEPWGGDVYASLEALIFDRGITPVLAHIDRYFRFLKDQSPIAELIGAGMLIQMNVEALEGFFSLRKAVKWIEAGLVHMLASDCHNVSERSPNLSKSREILKSRLDEETIRRLLTFSI
ncbi:hypothetical protein MASR2M70_03700 [Bacillota bacterium]